MPRTSFTTIAAAAATVLLLGLSACAPTPAPSGTASSGYITEGKLTIGTGLPAYYPWVIDDAPESGQGFESAVAYALADELGFAKEDVVWVRSTFEQAVAPGAKDFDVNLQQFSITDERKANVDFSSAYYETTQVVITTAASPAAKATSIADLKGLLIGAQTGTTSFDAAETQIAPTAGVQVFNTNDDAKLALETGVVDAIVVDLPTAFYLTGVELTGGIIVGQLPQTTGKGDAFGFVLSKDSPLTAAVTAAVDALRAKGTLAALADRWRAGAGDAPLLK